MVPHARDVIAWVACHVQDCTAVGLAARELGREEVTSRLGRAVELILGHVQVLGRPGVLQEFLAHTVFWAPILDEERPRPGHPHTTWWGVFCRAGEDRREQSGQKKRPEHVGREMILMALLSRRSIFSGSCSCIVESVVDLVSTLT